MMLGFWHTVSMGVGGIGLLCLALLSRHLRPEVRGPLRAGTLLARPGLLTPNGGRLWALGWVCVLFFNVMWWGSMIFK